MPEDEGATIIINSEEARETSYSWVAAIVVTLFLLVVFFSLGGYSLMTG